MKEYLKWKKKREKKRWGQPLENIFRAHIDFEINQSTLRPDSSSFNRLNLTLRREIFIFINKSMTILTKYWSSLVYTHNSARIIMFLMSIKLEYHGGHLI